MAEDWAAIAAEVATAIADIGFAITIEEPVIAGHDYDPVTLAPVLHVAKAIEDSARRYDFAAGATVTVRQLMIEAGVVVPQKGWIVQVRGERLRIGAVKPLAPGGVDLVYECEVDG